MKKYLAKLLDLDMKEVVRGASVALILRIMAAGLTFLLNVLLARFLGPDQSGLFFLSLTVVTIASVFGRMGIENTLLRFVASGLAQNDWAMVNGVSSKGLKVAIAASILMTILIEIVAPELSLDLFKKPELSELIRWMGLTILPMTLLMLYSQILKGFKKILYATFVSSVSVPLLTCLGLVLLVPTWHVQGATWAYVWATLVTMMMGLFLWQFVIRDFSAVKSIFATSKLIKSCRPLFLMSVCQVTMQWASVIMLGIWANNKDIGLFSVSQRTAVLISFILIAVNSISAPKFASFYGKGDIKSLEKVARKSSQVMSIVAAPLLIVCLFFPQDILSIFGSEFKEAGPLLRILAIGQYVSVACGSVDYVLMMTGHEAQAKNNTAFSSLLNILLNFVLISRMGVAGAAIATTISISLNNIVGSLLVKKLMGIWIFPVSLRKV